MVYHCNRKAAEGIPSDEEKHNTMDMRFDEGLIMFSWPSGDRSEANLFLSPRKILQWEGMPAERNTLKAAKPQLITESE